MTDLPTFAELAEARLAELGPRDKTINIKIARNTAQMMVWVDNGVRAALRKIALGRGPFKKDPYEHAHSCIEAMKDVARRALFGV